MADILAAVDITSVATWATALGVAIVGVTLIFKGADLGKRGVRKV